jgi:hypothetical protein
LVATFLAGTTFPAADLDVVAVVDSAGTTQLVTQTPYFVNPGVAPDRSLYPNLDAQIVGAAPGPRLGTTDTVKTIVVDRDGHVAEVNGAGSLHGEIAFPLRRPIVGIAVSGAGYWLAAADGGVFAFGDAQFRGSMGDRNLNQPVVGIVPYSRAGYWLVASDGGVFTFGNAHFHGSTGNLHLAAPIVGGAGTPSGNGYWLVAADGGVFAFGDARFYGSAAARHLTQPVVSIGSTRSGKGYWVTTADHQILNYGDAFHIAAP